MNIYKFLLFLIIAFGFDSLCAQHLFSVNYGDLSKDSVNMIKTKIANLKTPVSAMSMTRNSDNKDVYAFPISSVKNTKIVVLNEETGNSAVISPAEATAPQFELSPFFIEELRQAVLGNADRYLVVETDADFSVRKAVSVSTASPEVFIPRYFYGSKENVKEALPKDRQIIHIFKEKPILIPAFPDDHENLRHVALLEEEMSYYVYMYRLPDGTLCIYDEHFNPSVGKRNMNTRASTANLQFNLSGNMTGQGHTATLHALNLWSEQLAGTVPIDINVTLTSMGQGVLGASYRTPSYLINEIYYPSTLANQLLGFDFSTQRDIRLEMNSNYGWYYGLDGNTNGYDWVTIMLHEVTHGLGFFPLCGSNGAYTYTTSSGSSSNTSYPGIYDHQLFQGTTGNTCLTDLTPSQRAVLVISGNLYAGRSGSYLLAANNGTRVKIYAPNPWRAGSSVSHWDVGQTFPTFMQYAYQYPLHTFNTRKIGIMRDMGWEIPCPTLVNFTNQTVTTDTTITSCGDINVQYVTVKTGAKLTLIAAGEVNIISDFEVELGAELEINW